MCIRDRNWGSTYTRPGIRSKLLASLFRIVPKVGPLRPLAFRKLTPETEKMYMASFNSTIASYRQLLSEVNAGHLKLANDNLDVGTFTAPGKYRLTDATYSQLLHKMQGRYTDMPPEIRSDILAFYHNLGVPEPAQANDSDWARVLIELDQLQSVDADLHPAAGGGSSSR